MIELDRIAYCKFTPRKQATPRLAVLIPQKDSFEGESIIGGGFCLIPLPFANDRRKFPIAETPRCRSKLSLF